MKNYKNPNVNGYYGEFGGAFVPEMLYPNVEELQKNYIEIIESESFRKEYEDLLKNYVGRATPLYFAKNFIITNEMTTPIGIRRISVFLRKKPVFAFRRSLRSTR